DQFPNAQITFTSSAPADSVSYAYSGHRWVPSPKRNGPRLLTNSGYSEVMYIAADEARVTPRREDFTARRRPNVLTFIQNHANAVFNSQKFTGLKTVNVRRGVGQQAFVLEVSPGVFASEKNFSLGELAVLKLLRKLESSKNNALVIIDELEIALHPV